MKNNEELVKDLLERLKKLNAATFFVRQGAVSAAAQ